MNRLSLSRLFLIPNRPKTIGRGKIPSRLGVLLFAGSLFLLSVSPVPAQIGGMGQGGFYGQNGQSGANNQNAKNNQNKESISFFQQIKQSLSQDKNGLPQGVPTRQPVPQQQFNPYNNRGTGFNNGNLRSNGRNPNQGPNANIWTGQNSSNGFRFPWSGNSAPTSNPNMKGNNRQPAPTGNRQFAQNPGMTRYPNGAPQASPRASAQSVPTGNNSIDQLMKPSTTRESASEAIQQIPWNQLSPSARQIAESLVSQHSIYRRLPLAGGYCNPEVYDFLLCHPEVVIGIWQTLGFSQFDLSEPEKGHYVLKENSGTTADIQVLYHDNEMILIYCFGVYHGQVVANPIQGEALALLQYRFTEDKNHGNAPIVISRLDSFIRLNNTGADMVGRAFGPLVGKVIDSNFVKTVESVNEISETIEKNPGLMIDTIQAAKSISPAAKNEMMIAIDRISSQAFLRERGEQVDYFLLPKPNVPQVAPARILARKGEPRSTVPPAYQTVALPTESALPAEINGGDGPIPVEGTSSMNGQIVLEDQTAPSLPIGNDSVTPKTSAPSLPGGVLTKEKMETFALIPDSRSKKSGPKSKSAPLNLSALTGKPTPATTTESEMKEEKPSESETEIDFNQEDGDEMVQTIDSHPESTDNPLVLPEMTESEPSDASGEVVSHSAKPVLSGEPLEKPLSPEAMRGLPSTTKIDPLLTLRLSPNRKQGSGEKIATNAEKSATPDGPIPLEDASSPSTELGDFAEPEDNSDQNWKTVTSATGTNPSAPKISLHQDSFAPESENKPEILPSSDSESKSPQNLWKRPTFMNSTTSVERAGENLSELLSQNEDSGLDELTGRNKEKEVVEIAILPESGFIY